MLLYNGMKLSFVIPAYNEEAYLPKCLEAVLAEKKRGKYDIEVIVVNNASTDSTRQVALSYPGVIVVDEPKKGLSAARQAGFMVATGDIIANIDSDSILTLEWIDTVMTTFAKRPNLVALSGPFIYHDLSLFSNFLVRIQYNIDYVFYIIHRFVLRSSSLLQGGNFVVRKTYLDQIGGFNTAFVFWGEDTNLAKRLHPLGPVVFTFKLPIYSSGRRLKKEGLLTMCYKYSMNYFSTIIFDKPFSASYMDIRHAKHKQAFFKTNLNMFNKALFYSKLSFVFVIFSLMGGSVYLYNEAIDTLVPATALASVIDIKDHPVLSKVHNSIVKFKAEVNKLEVDADADDN